VDHQERLVGEARARDAMTTAQPEGEGAVGEREHLEARHAGLQQILDARDARVRFGRGEGRDGSRHITLAHGPVANRDLVVGGRGPAARLVAGVLPQGRIKVHLGLRNGPPHLVGLDGLHDPRIGVVVVQAVRPVGLIFRIATHQVEPALRLVRELQVTLDEYRVAQHQLVERAGVVGRTGAVLGAGAVAGPGAGHVEVGHGRGGVPERVWRLRVDQRGLGVAVERDVDVALAAVDIPLYRYAEALLIYAEAQNE